MADEQRTKRQNADATASSNEAGSTPDARQARGERTRQALIDAAFLEIHRHGYRAASLNDILSAAGSTKGSLYHHFPDKHALGLAAISEHIDRFISNVWIAPLAKTSDPLTTVAEIIADHVNGKIFTDVRLGCPVQNLSQEMAPLDEDFRLYLTGVFDKWIEAVSGALKRGIDTGTVSPDIDANGVAAMIIATHQGIVGLIKTAQNPTVGATTAPTFFKFLETMRPAPDGTDPAHRTAS